MLQSIIINILKNKNNKNKDQETKSEENKFSYAAGLFYGWEVYVSFREAFLININNQESYH